MILVRNMVLVLQKSKQAKTRMDLIGKTVRWKNFFEVILVKICFLLQNTKIIFWFSIKNSTTAKYIFLVAGVYASMFMLPLPQVGPVKLVCVQSQMNLFQPSMHFPPCMQGLFLHFGGIMWQEGRMEPESWLLAKSATSKDCPLMTKSLKQPTKPLLNPADHRTGGRKIDSTLASKPPKYKGLTSSKVSASPGVSKSILSVSTNKLPLFLFLVTSNLCQAPSSTLWFEPLNLRLPEPKSKWRYRYPSSNSKAKKSPYKENNFYNQGTNYRVFEQLLDRITK